MLPNKFLPNTEDSDTLLIDQEKSVTLLIYRKMYALFNAIKIQKEESTYNLQQSCIDCQKCNGKLQYVRHKLSPIKKRV